MAVDRVTELYADSATLLAADPDAVPNGTRARAVDTGLEWEAVGGDGARTWVEVGAHGHYEVLLSGSPPVALTNDADDDWLYGKVS